MIINLMKLIFGKVIGLDAIPKEKRDAFVKEVAVPILKEAIASYIKSEGKEVMLKYTKKF